MVRRALPLLSLLVVRGTIDVKLKYLIGVTLIYSMTWCYRNAAEDTRTLGAAGDAANKVAKNVETNLHTHTNTNTNTHTHTAGTDLGAGWGKEALRVSRPSAIIAQCSRALCTRLLEECGFRPCVCVCVLYACVCVCVRVCVCVCVCVSPE